ncbi:MAG: ECF transporter S component [Erysipelotrichaceae bacterium]|nr:ECF transporter S component [Erysipelotrichaceae bacterium]
MNDTTKKLTKTAILGALAAVLMWVEFAIPPFPSFYKLDFSEVPVLLGAFSMGPLEGIAIEAVKIIIKLLIKPTSTMFIGELANFIVGIALVVPAAWIYKRNKTKKEAIKGLVIGTLCMGIAGALFNYFILLPMYVNIMGLDAILGAASDMAVIKNLETLVIFGTFPFNLIKGVVVSMITVLMYKHLSPLLHQ